MTTTNPAERRRSSVPRTALEQAAWPRLPPGLVARLREAGAVSMVSRGDVVFDVGQPSYDLVYIEEGAVEIVERAGGRTLVTIEAGNFVGELGMLMGQGTFLACVASRPSRLLVVPPAALRTLLATVPELTDAIVTAFAARRRLLVEWNEGGLVVVGREGDPQTMRLLAFASRNRIPHRYVDRTDLPALAEIEAACPLPPDGAAAVAGHARLVEPTPRAVARALGMDLVVDAAATYDVVVVGAGPSGLAAAVYGASEGLSTLVVEDTAIGGQAGTSSRIENYLGFATGVSGGELAYQGEIQALKFGARFATPLRAVALSREEGRFVLTLDDGARVRARAVVLATGATYRRLPLDGLERLEGAGIYYAATELEARFCRDGEAVVVGGGNSAGQAAMFLSRHAHLAHVVVRGEGLAETMSRYLAERLGADPRIRLWMRTEVAALHGDAALEAVDLVDRRTGETTRVATRALFVMIGAAPNTGWLDGVVALDAKGFVETGGPEGPFATSLPGVFAVGDVRSGSVKRVASAVGEGSVAIAAVHGWLARAG